MKSKHAETAPLVETGLSAACPQAADRLWHALPLLLGCFPVKFPRRLRHSCGGSPTGGKTAAIWCSCQAFPVRPQKNMTETAAAGLTFRANCTIITNTFIQFRGAHLRKTFEEYQPPISYKWAE